MVDVVTTAAGTGVVGLTTVSLTLSAVFVVAVSLSAFFALAGALFLGAGLSSLAVDLVVVFALAFTGALSAESSFLAVAFRRVVVVDVLVVAVAGLAGVVASVVFVSGALVAVEVSLAGTFSLASVFFLALGFLVAVFASVDFDSTGLTSLF